MAERGFDRPQEGTRREVAHSTGRGRANSRGIRTGATSPSTTGRATCSRRGAPRCSHPRTRVGCAPAAGTERRTTTAIAAFAAARARRHPYNISAPPVCGDEQVRDQRSNERSATLGSRSPGQPFPGPENPTAVAFRRGCLRGRMTRVPRISLVCASIIETTTPRASRCVIRIVVCVTALPSPRF